MAQTAVIAGVGPGLGAALARRFRQGGCRVGLLARSSDYIAELAAESPDFLAVPTDLADAAQVRAAFALIRQTFGPIDLLVYNASGSVWRGLAELSPADFERGWRVSVYGALLCCQAVLPDMDLAGGGTILFTGATSSIRGRKGALDFSSAKFGLRGLADALARELWPRRIHVAHVLIDGEIGTPGERGTEPVLEPGAIAETYWQLVLQNPSAWTFELELRPHAEDFFS